MGSVLWIPVALILFTVYLYILSTNVPELKDNVIENSEYRYVLSLPLDLLWLQVPAPAILSLSCQSSDLKKSELFGPEEVRKGNIQELPLFFNFAIF